MQNCKMNEIDHNKVNIFCKKEENQGNYQGLNKTGLAENKRRARLSLKLNFWRHKKMIEKDSRSRSSKINSKQKCDESTKLNYWRYKKMREDRSRSSRMDIKQKCDTFRTSLNILRNRNRSLTPQKFRKERSRSPMFGGSDRLKMKTRNVSIVALSGKSVENKIQKNRIIERKPILFRNENRIRDRSLSVQNRRSRRERHEC